jgi:hypothetical protein
MRQMAKQRAKNSPTSSTPTQKPSTGLTSAPEPFSNAHSRIPVIRDSHFAALIAYIHHNPQQHGFVDDFRDWPYSSYQVLMKMQPSCLAQEQVLDAFGDHKTFIQIHSSVKLKDFGDWSDFDAQ